MKKLDEKFFTYACKAIIQEKEDDKHTSQLKHLEMNQLWKEVELRTQSKKKKRLIKRIIIATSAVAMLAVLLFSWELILHSNTHSQSSDYLALLENINVESYTNTSLVESDKITELEDHASVAYTESGETITDSKIEEKTCKNEELISLKKLITPKGKQASLTLSDGTTVKLNSGSKIIFPALFEGNERVVAIEGEAYFDVTHNPQKPFIVRTKSSLLKVLGTSFCVRDYTEELDSHIILLTGSLAVQTNNGDDTQLEINQIIHIKNNSKVKVENVNPEEYISWIKHIMMIQKGQTLNGVVEQLEKHYGISITYDKGMANNPIQGKIFLEEEVDIVLSNISKVVGTNITKSK